MRIILLVVLVALGLGGGLAVGTFLGTDRADVEPELEVDPSDHDTDHDGTDEDGHDYTEDRYTTSVVRVTPANTGTEYVRLNNQFVVPIVRHGSVRSLVIMALTLEVQDGYNEQVFLHEPRLRDSFLRVMFTHANAGGFDGSFTDSASMAPLREGLMEAALVVLGEGIVDVLIVDITRQDA